MRVRIDQFDARIKNFDRFAVIVEVSGEPVSARPYLDWREWESRTRSAVRQAYDSFAEGKGFTEPAGEPAEANQ